MFILRLYTPKKVRIMHGSFGQNTLNRHMLTNDVRPMHAMFPRIQNKGVLAIAFFLV